MYLFTSIMHIENRDLRAFAGSTDTNIYMHNTWSRVGGWVGVFKFDPDKWDFLRLGKTVF